MQILFAGMATLTSRSEGRIVAVGTAFLVTRVLGREHVPGGSPGTDMIQRRGRLVAGNAGACLVADFAAIPVPCCGGSVGSHPPQAGVAAGAFCLVAGVAGGCAVAGRAVLSVAVEDPPLRCFSVGRLPVRVVIFRNQVLSTLAMAGGAGLFGNFHAVFLVTCSTLFEAHGAAFQFTGIFSVTIFAFAGFGMHFVGKANDGFRMLTGLVAGNIFVVTVHASFFLHCHAVGLFGRLVAVIAG